MSATVPRGWFAVFVVLVFTLGVGTGMILRGAIEESPAAASVPADPARPPSIFIVPQLAEALDLDADQQDALARIVETRRQRLLEDRQRLEGRIGSEILALTREVDAILTPEQRARFGPIVARVRARLAPAGAEPGAER